MHERVTDMIELEILVKVNNSVGDVEKCLKRFGISHNFQIIDTYYFDPKRNDLLPCNGKLFSCFRLREKQGKAFLTYKKDHYDDSTWIYSDEYETEVGDALNTKQIIKSLGYIELLKLSSQKKYYYYNEYEIVLEIVENLGVFLEVEYKAPSTKEYVEENKEKIRQFISELNLDVGEELNSGKPELYLQIHGIPDF